MGQNQSAELEKEREKRKELEEDQAKEIKRLEALKNQQIKKDRQKQLELEEKLREFKARESEMQAEKLRQEMEQKKEAAEKLRQEMEHKKEAEQLAKQLEDMKVQQQKEKDAEVKRRKYLEPLDTPWRRISTKRSDPWKEEFKNELLLKIKTIKPPGGIDFFNILLLGQAAAGKSSFFNTCCTALMNDDRMIEKNQVYQGASRSVTTSVEAIPLQTKDKEVVPLRLFDCRGLNEVHGVPTEDIRLIIEGHVKSGYKINPETPITKDDPKYRNDPILKDRMHCVVYVTNADNPSEQLTDEETEKQLKHVREMKAVQHLPQVVLLANIDKVRISNTNDLRDIFRSQGVKDVCVKAAEYMQIPLMNVLPMSNYHEEILPTLEKDILALFYLLTMMQRANDYIIRTDDAPEDFYD